MTHARDAKEGKRTPGKRLLAAGAKINGTWQVTTFLRPASGAIRPPFWEATRPPVRRPR